MAKLTIPTKYRAGVSKIRTLDGRSAKEIRDSLDRLLEKRIADEDVATSSKLHEVSTSAIQLTSQAKTTDFRQIADAVASLYVAKSTRDISTEEFVEEVTDAMESLDSEELRLPHEGRSEFKEKLGVLLSADVFGVVSKALDLRTEDERVFCDARILTDLRPVFGSRIEDGPRGMIIVHLLKLGYHHAGSGDHRQFYVSLDAEDLQTLRKLIDRAEAKAKSLKSSIPTLRLFGMLKE